MKVKVLVEYEVESEKELLGRDHSNMVGMLVRMTRNRVFGFVSRRLGGEGAATGWEVNVKAIEVAPVTRTAKRE